MRQNMTSRRNIIITLGLICLPLTLGSAYWAASTSWGRAEAGETPFAEPLPVITFTARPVESYERLRPYTGVLRELRRSQLGFQRAGEIIELARLVIEVDTELDSLERIRQTPIALGRDGRFVPLGNIADISKGVEMPVRSLTLVDGKPAIALGALVQSGRRVDRWSAAFERELEKIAAELPAGVRLKTLFQQNEYVESRLGSLLMNLMLGALAVVGVVWLMMGWRSAIVVGAALPLSSLLVLSGNGTHRRRNQRFHCRAGRLARGSAGEPGGAGCHP